MRCQSKVNCNSQVCWRQGNLQELWLQKEEEDNGFDGCLGCENDKIWKQSSEKDMPESKMKPRLRAEELTGMISLLRDKFVRSENLRRCCFVPMRRNSVLDGLRSNLFKFIQERMSVKVVVSVSRHRAEFVGVKEMYSWVSSAYKWYLREFFEITEPRGVV